MSEETKKRIGKLYREGKAFLKDPVAKQFADYYYPLEEKKVEEKKEKSLKK